MKDRNFMQDVHIRIQEIVEELGRRNKRSDTFLPEGSFTWLVSYPTISADYPPSLPTTLRHCHEIRRQLALTCCKCEKVSTLIKQLPYMCSCSYQPTQTKRDSFSSDISQRIKSIEIKDLVDAGCSAVEEEWF